MQLLHFLHYLNFPFLVVSTCKNYLQAHFLININFSHSTA
uniref:Uncharacterized protein n=1 Tax=Francisella tularensis subsp. mediasiatica TaxID=135248 RepID=Q7WZK1_FRATU|nr:unknown [Francisella tularensis subsp. mediasiatica FSC147]